MNCNNDYYITIIEPNEIEIEIETETDINTDIIVSNNFFTRLVFKFSGKMKTDCIYNIV
jgi:hypothetical protein